MALIKCGECNHDVSDKAAACPKCGAPILGASESVAAGSNIQTIQVTSKKFKMQQILAVLLVIFGFLINAGIPNSKDDPSVLAPTFIAVGLVWYIVTRFRIWWHHK